MAKKLSMKKLVSGCAVLTLILGHNRETASADGFQSWQMYCAVTASASKSELAPHKLRPLQRPSDTIMSAYLFTHKDKLILRDMGSVEQWSWEDSNWVHVEAVS